MATDSLHGDLRPDTIIVTHKGSAKTPRIRDVAMDGRRRRPRAEAARAPRISAPDSMSVVSYMSPEQLIGGAVDAPHRHLFRLGVIAYEMLTGSNPFAAATADGHGGECDAAARCPRAVALSTSLADLDTLIAKAMSKEIAGRPQSAGLILRELRGIGAILDVRAGMTAHPSCCRSTMTRAARRSGGSLYAAIVAVAGSRGGS
jgi:serine/threonine protein kinase